MTAGPVEALQVFQQREIALQFLNVIAVPHRRWSSISMALLWAECLLDHR
jgi:hypothetical protein